MWSSSLREMNCLISRYENDYNKRIRPFCLCERHMTPRRLLVFAAFLLIAADTTQSDLAKRDVQRLQGTWVVDPIGSHSLGFAVGNKMGGEFMLEVEWVKVLKSDHPEIPDP